MKFKFMIGEYIINEPNSGMYKILEINKRFDCYRVKPCYSNGNPMKISPDFNWSRKRVDKECKSLGSNIQWIKTLYER